MLPNNPRKLNSIGANGKGQKALNAIDYFKQIICGCFEPIELSFSIHTFFYLLGSLFDLLILSCQVSIRFCSGVEILL